MEAAPDEGTPARLLGRLYRSGPAAWLLCAVALVGLVNLVVLIAQAPALINGLYTNADHASGLVLPALTNQAPAGSFIKLGNHPWFEPWWFMRATSGIGDYRVLWEVAPFVIGLLGIAVVSVCAWWALGRVAGLLCGATLLATSETVRGILYVPESHGAVVLHVGIACAALMLVHRAALGKRTARTLVLAGAPLTAFTAVGLSDQQLLISGLGPFVLAPMVCWVRSRSGVWRTVTLFALTSGVAALLVSIWLTHLMKHHHVAQSPYSITFVSSSALVEGLQNLVTDFTQLGGGNFFGASASGESLFTFSAGVLTLLALAAILRALWLRGKSAFAESASLDVQLRELYVTYWGMVVIFVLAAFALTSLAEAPQPRYLIAAWAGVPALLGVLASAPLARTAILIGVALFGALNVRSELAHGPAAAGPGPSTRVASAIERFASSYGARIGYSGYWDSHPVTWETHLRVKVFPIETCASASSSLCADYLASIDTWYRPRAGVRSFLLTDTRPHVPTEVRAPPPALGTPLAQSAVGNGLTVYVYNYDIARALG